MAFDLSKYEFVDARIRRFRENYPDGRIVTTDYTSPQDREMGIFRVRTEIFLTAGDQANGLPSATGHAFEIEGGGGSIANKFAALENCETSSVGRAIAILEGARASADEMQKVQRGEQRELDSVDVPETVFESIVSATSLDDLKSVWDESVRGGYSRKIQASVNDRKAELIAATK